MIHEVTFTHKLKGEYRMVVNAGTPEERDSGWFPNIVLNQGLDGMAAGVNRNVLANCCIGTGASTPVATQTALDAYVAQNSTVGTITNTNIGASTYAQQYTVPYTFAVGAVVGNMAEVGVGWGAAGANLFSRALIVDGAGNPTTLTLTSIDQLTVYYRVTVSPQLTDTTGTFVIGATTYSYTARLSLAASFGINFGNIQFLGVPVAGQSYCYNGATIGAITGQPTGGTFLSLSFTATPGSYTAGNYRVDCTCSFGSADGNVSGGITNFWWSFSGNVANQQQYTQMSVSPAIPKDNTKTMTLVTRFAYSR